MSRIGFGYDVHAFASGRKMVLGGVTIPFDKGLAGHSDADVLVHAIMDALLGAAAIGDIGTRFPDTDSKYKDADSMELLEEVVRLLKTHHYFVENVDATIVLQIPKIQLFIPQMRQRISEKLHINILRVSVKATTTEHLGFIGRGEGVAAYAVALINNILD